MRAAWMMIATLAACALEPPADVVGPDDGPGETDAPQPDAPDAAIDAVDAPDGMGLDAVDAPDAPIDAPDAPIDAPMGPTLVSASVPLRIEIDDTVQLTLVVSGTPNTVLAWQMMPAVGGGQFQPNAAMVSLNSSGVGTISVDYIASSGDADYAHTLTLFSISPNASSTWPIETKVRELDAAGELVPFPDNAGISIAPGNLYGQQIYIPRPVVMMKLGLNAQLGGYSGRMALYSNVGGAPRDLVVGSGLQVITVGPNDLPVTPTMVPQGTYWLMGNFSAGASIKRNAAANTGLAYVMLNTTAPLPTTIGSPSATNNRVLNYHVRFAD